MAVQLHHDGLKWIEKYTENVIKELHLRLEAPHLDSTESDIIRGEIRRSRLILEDATDAVATGKMI